MKHITKILSVVFVYLMISCSNGNLNEKGFQVGATSEDNETEQNKGLNRDSLKLETRPGGILLTGIPHLRLTTVYKVNIAEKGKATFIGTNNFLDGNGEPESDTNNNWNNNLMPGFEAVSGYNMVNVSLYDIKENKQRTFFTKPVLIKTLYFPSFSKDTLNNKPVQRKYFMVSVYNEDVNKDGFINNKDLRRFYLFDLNGGVQKALVPENYSVFKSEYDPENDFMYISAQLDANGNGQRDEGESIHIFWVDLKDPTKTGQLY